MSSRVISSRENPQYKQIRQLASSAQARRKAGLTVLDGVHLCETWLQHKGAPSICVAGDAARAHRLQHQFRRIKTDKTMLHINRQRVISLCGHDLRDEGRIRREPTIDDRLVLGPKFLNAIRDHDHTVT